MSSEFNYIPGKEKPLTSCVTDREVSELLENFKLDPNHIQPQDLILVAGSSLLFTFETYLKESGAIVGIIDQSLSFSSHYYQVNIRPRHSHYAAIFVSKNSGKKLDDAYTDEEFVRLRRERWGKVMRICTHVFTGTIPTLKISDHLQKVNWFLDCMGPAYYIPRKMISLYLTDILKTLDPISGQAIIFPVDSNWKKAIKNLEDVSYEFYGTDTDFSGAKIKIKK